MSSAKIATEGDGKLETRQKEIARKGTRLMSFSLRTMKSCYNNVKPKSDDWKRIEKRIHDTLPQHRIVQIQAVSNPYREFCFELKKLKLELSNVVPNIVCDVFFAATDRKIYDYICLPCDASGGFDVRLANDTICTYGAGMYFAKEAVYPLGIYPRQKPDDKGNVSILVADILLGNSQDYGNKISNQSDTHPNRIRRRGNRIPGSNSEDPEMYEIYDSIQGTEANKGDGTRKVYIRRRLAKVKPRKPHGSVEYGKQYIIFDTDQAKPTFKVTLKLDENFYDGRTYKYNERKMTWDEHEQEAIRWGGHITSVLSQDENNFISQISNGMRTWLGGRRRTGKIQPPNCSDVKKYGGQAYWEWSDGSKWEHTDWYENQPDNYKGRQSRIRTNWKRTGKWDDASATVKCAAVYKK